MDATFVGATNSPATSEAFVPSHSSIKPAGAQLIIAWLEYWTGTGSGSGVITPSGGSGTWVQRINSTAGQTRTVCFLKYVEADSAGQTYTFTATAQAWSSLKTQYVSDIDTAQDLSAVPIHLPAATSGTGFATATVAAAAGGFLSWHGNTTEYSGSPSHAPPTNFTETGDTFGSGAAYRISPGAGPQSASGATCSVSVNNKKSSLLTIAPAAAEEPAEVTVAIPLTLAVGAEAQAAHDATAEVPLSLAIGAEAVAVHQVTASIPLEASLGAESATSHDVTAELSLALEVSPVTDAPIVGEANVTAEILLGLSLGAVTAAPEEELIEVTLLVGPLGMGIQIGPLTESQISAEPLGTGRLQAGALVNPEQIGVLAMGPARATIDEMDPPGISVGDMQEHINVGELKERDE